tara:strand:- start:747 stop:1178 length:432 start_codon:yes stop_codon:yes gene_type:complete
MEIEQIEQIVREAHGGQKRWNGDDYVTHPIRVSDNMPNKITQDVALLHDVMEDTKVTFKDLLNKGVSQEIIEILQLLTRKKGQSYLEYIKEVEKSINNNVYAATVKIGDLEDNLIDLKKGHMRDKYELALYLLETKLKEKLNE